MPEAAAVAIANFAAEYFAADAIATFLYAKTAIEVAAVVGSIYTVRDNERRRQARARSAWNDSQRDRYTMVRSAVEPRRLVLGRQRVSGPLVYIGSYGQFREHLVMVLPLAAHQVHAIDEVFFDDEPVRLDGDGNVVAVSRRDTFAISSGGGEFALSSEPVAASVTASVSYGSTELDLTVDSVSGTHVFVSGATSGTTGQLTIRYEPAANPYSTSTQRHETQAATITTAGVPVTITLAYTPDVPAMVSATMPDFDSDMVIVDSVVGRDVTLTPLETGTVIVSYQRTEVSTYCRVRKYLGAPGQAADAGMVAALPGIWTTAHRMTGMAYLVVEADYNPDTFPGGLFNVSANVRGALLRDPRTGVTAYSENPALMVPWVATHPLLTRAPASLVDDDNIASAAAICDQTADYVVSGRTYSVPKYRAGCVVKSGTRAKDVIDDLVAAMAGRWCISEGTLRIRPGAPVTPLETLDDSWLHNAQAVEGQAGDAREDTFNVVSGKFVDAERDYRERDFPQVASAAYIAADGGELPTDMDLRAVAFVGQAQQVVASQMRDARQSLRVTVLCNMRAFRVQVFDVLLVTLPRFGWDGKRFEVLETSFTLDGGIQLVLKETDPTAWDLGLSFSSVDPAPNTRFPSYASLPVVQDLLCESGPAQALVQADGVVIGRMRVSWTPITDAFVVVGGGIEVQFGRDSEPEPSWQIVRAVDGQSQVYITGLVEGRRYLVRARCVTPLTRGEWTELLPHTFGGGSSLLPRLAWVSAFIASAQLFFASGPLTDRIVIAATVTGVLAGNQVLIQGSLSAGFTYPAFAASALLRVQRGATVLLEMVPSLTWGSTESDPVTPIVVGPIVDVPGAGDHEYSIHLIHDRGEDVLTHIAWARNAQLVLQEKNPA